MSTPLPNSASAQLSEAPRWPAHVALVFVQLFFGLFPLAAVYAYEGFEPRAIAAWRILAGSIVLGGLAAAIHGRGMIPKREDLVRFQICSLLGIALNQVAFLEGVKRAPNINAALMIATIPCMTWIVALIARQEHFCWRRAIGISIAFAGILIMFQEDVRHLVGNRLLFLNALCYSIYLVISKPLTKKYPPLVVIAWVFILSAWVVPIFSWEAEYIPPEASTKAWAALSFIVLCPTILGYLFNLFALRQLAASTTAVYIFSQPLIITTAAIMFRGEALTVSMLWAALCVFLGMGLVLSRRSPR